MEHRELIAALEAAEGSLVFGGPIALDPIQKNVYRLTAGSSAYLLKWIDDDDERGLHEIDANRNFLTERDIAAPLLIMTRRVDGGTVACWEWLDGSSLRDRHRSLLPTAFSEIARFHARRRHDGPVVSPTLRQTLPSVAALVDAEIEHLLPVVERSQRRVCAACLMRLVQGYATVIHGDVHPGNIVLTERGLHFVDWSHAVASLSFFDLEYVESVPLDPPMQSGAYMPPPESAGILKAYADHCGIPDLDITGVHLAVMLWRDLHYYVSSRQQAHRDERRDAIYRRRLAQLIGHARERT